MMEGKIFKKTKRVAHASKFQDNEDSDKVAKQKSKRLRATLNKLKASSKKHDTDTDDDDLVDYVRLMKLKKARAVEEPQEDEPPNFEGEALFPPHNVIARGAVTNTDFNLPMSEENSGGASPFKIKLKVQGVNLYNLRVPPKPDRLNEINLSIDHERSSYGQLESSLSKKKTITTVDNGTEPVDDVTVSQAMKQIFNKKIDGLNGITKKGKTRKGRAQKAKEEHFSPVVIKKIREKLSRWTPTMPAPKVIVKLHETIHGFSSEKFSEVENPPPKVLLRECGRDMDWDEYFDSPENLQCIPPVTYFKLAPFCDIWNKIAVPGMYIELRNPFINRGRGDVFWIGRIVHFAGYKALVKFETFEDAPTDDETNYMVWISFCSKVPRPLGWCANNGKELCPGPIVSKKMSAAQFAQKMAEMYASPKPTIREDHETMLSRELEVVEKTWKPNGKYEALDLVSFHQNRLVRVSAIAGNRVNMQYYRDVDPEDEDDYDAGFWFDWRSDALHKFMWSHSVGVQLNGINPAYRGLELPRDSFQSWPDDKIKIELGMRLETRHPNFTNKFVGAVIIKVLKFGHFMIQTRDERMLGRVNFVYHITSPFIFPVGFGKSHNIDVEFAVDNFGETIEASVSETAPCLKLDLLPPRTPHKFRIGHKLEAVEITTSTYIGPATVTKIAGHMLYIYFDGWRNDLKDNYQWVDAENSEIYPAGYSEMMGFDWQGIVRRK